MPFLTGRQSKLAKLMEDAIREQSLIEFELVNGEVLYGKVHAYELTTEHFILTIEAEKNMIVINFRQVVKMRLKHKA